MSHLSGSEDRSLVEAAKELLSEDPIYRKDAEIGARVSNSVVGSILAITRRAPRWATEAAVRQALKELRKEGC